MKSLIIILAIAVLIEILLRLNSRRNEANNPIPFDLPKPEIKINTTPFKWPFLIALLILFLAEIGMRRLWENRNYR